MTKTQITRSLLAIATMVTLWSAPVMLQATPLQPLIVTGIALDKVAVAHPVPEYPPTALRFHIDGHVQVTVKVQNGKIVEASASADAPILGLASKEWIVRCWKFKPDVTGVFTIPITYKRQA
jgi:outer membrane biosynthesis protein TonB